MGNCVICMWPIEWHRCQWPWMTLNVTLVVWNIFDLYTSQNVACVSRICLFIHGSESVHALQFQLFLFSELKDIWRSQSITYAVNEVVSGKWCKIELLLLHTTIYGDVIYDLCWFTSYVNNRQQSVPSPVEFGVPASSVLGPMLFLLYTADIRNVVRNRNRKPLLSAVTQHATFCQQACSTVSRHVTCAVMLGLRQCNSCRHSHIPVDTWTPVIRHLLGYPDTCWIWFSSTCSIVSSWFSMKQHAASFAELASTTTCLLSN